MLSFLPAPLRARAALGVGRTGAQQIDQRGFAQCLEVVFLRHVRDLVRQHRRHLRLALRRKQQARVHPDKSAGHGEGIDGVVLDHEELEVQARVGIHCGEAVPERIDVIRQFRIIEIARVPEPDIPHRRLADASFDLRRQNGSGGVAQFR